MIPQSTISPFFRWHHCVCSFSGLFTLLFVGTCVLGFGRGDGFESVGEDLQERFVKLEKTQRLAESTFEFASIPPPSPPSPSWRCACDA